MTTRDEVGPSAETPLDDLALRVVEEHLSVGKRRVATGVVRISATTEVVEEVAEVELDRYRVEVTRIPVGRIVDEVPLARSEGDTTVVPVVEERFVVVKQLFLKEELHIRHVVEREVARETVALRRQKAVVERLDATGRAMSPDQCVDTALDVAAATDSAMEATQAVPPAEVEVARDVVYGTIAPSSYQRTTETRHR